MDLRGQRWTPAEIAAALDRWPKDQEGRPIEFWGGLAFNRITLDEARKRWPAPRYEPQIQGCCEL